MNKQITVISGVLLHKNKILLSLRTEKELQDAHMRWEFPGGKVDFGETPEEALKREFIEETGRRIKIKKLLPMVNTHYWNYSWGVQQTLCFIFYCSLVKEGQPKKKDHHVLESKWFTFEEIKKLNTLPGTNEILSIVKKMQK